MLYMTLPRPRFFAWVAGFIALTLAAAGVFVVTNRQHLEDLYAASQYSASPAMQEVIDRVGFTSDAETIFRASTPSLEAATTFSAQCAAVIHQESDQVIGCYTGSAIHLFEITDDRLDGMVEVTAAHEMLHAAYRRLPASEKRALAIELQAEYERLSKEDPSLVARMAVYDHLNEADFTNELHSVLGTEVTELSPSLEKYYARYFSDRGMLQQRFARYDSYFKELESQRTALRDQLTALGSSIESRSASYQAALEAYNADVTSLGARNERFEFANDTATFYRLRDALTSRRALLESDRASLNSDIEHYNTLREELVQLDATADQLVRSMSSSLPAPAPTGS